MTTSVDSSQRGTIRSALAPPGSRRGLAAFAARSGGSWRSSGDAGSPASSRPGSAISKTHVPSLAAQGFFKPMSSQKLQAQRGQGQVPGAQPRPTSALAQNVRSRRSEDSQTRHRYSNASVNTLRDGLPPTRDEDAPPLPTSRGTMYTNDGTQPETLVAASVVSNNSTAPLQARQGMGDLKVETNGQRKSNNSSQPPPKSPKSLRASLGLGSRRASKHGDDRRPSPAHEKLHSDPSSPNDTEDVKPPLPLPTTQFQSRPQAGRNYEYFAGNMLFFIRGRLLNTRAQPLNVATFILTTLPAVLFFAFSAPWLWRHVSPALPVIFAYIFFLTISAFLHAAFSDPGILPRNLHPHPQNPEEERDPLTVGPPTTEWVMVKTFPSASRRSKSGGGDEEAGSGNTTAMEVPTKYCKSCSIWRPPRAHHCRVCDACIETQDHHCVWLNNCVGRRNYRFFFSYVGFASLLAIMLLAFSITHVALYAHQHGIPFSRSLSGRTEERMAFAMFIYAIVALPYPGSLFVYHLFLLARGETTREYLNSHKFLPKDRHRPFTQSSWIKNWEAVLMRPRPPTYLQFKRPYVEGDLRLGHTTPKKQRLRDLKNRYSVGNGTGGGEKQGMEMKPLPPQPPQSRNGGQAPPPTQSGSSPTNGAKVVGMSPQVGVGAGMGSGGGVGVNSTPR